jgi:hypothetical protein
MPGPSERLPDKKSEILVEGAKLKLVLNARGEVEILGNRKGLSPGCHLFRTERICER